MYAQPGGVRRRFGGWIVDVKRKTTAELIEEQRTQSNWAEAELGPWAVSKLRLSFNVLTAERTEEVDWPATIKQITCPTLLITADPEQGAIVKAEQAAAFQDLLPQAQVVHIPGAGHNIRREQYERFIEVIQTFLAG